MTLPDLALPTGPFEGREALAAALRLAMAQAQRSLRLMDRDLSDWPIEEPTSSARLERLLTRSRRAWVRILVRDERWLERGAPRLAALRRRVGGAVEVRRIADDAEGVPGGLLIVDGDCAVERFHAEAFRGRLVVGPSDGIEALQRCYDRLWEDATPCLPLTTLGL